jgi:hypothetical protein
MISDTLIIGVDCLRYRTAPSAKTCVGTGPNNCIVQVCSRINALFCLKGGESSKARPLGITFTFCLKLIILKMMFDPNSRLGPVIGMHMH